MNSPSELPKHNETIETLSKDITILSESIIYSLEDGIVNKVSTVKHTTDSTQELHKIETYRYFTSTEYFDNLLGKDGLEVLTIIRHGTLDKEKKITKKKLFEIRKKLHEYKIGLEYPGILGHNLLKSFTHENIKKLIENSPSKTSIFETHNEFMLNQSKIALMQLYNHAKDLNIVKIHTALLFKTFNKTEQVSFGSNLTSLSKKIDKLEKSMREFANELIQNVAKFKDEIHIGNIYATVNTLSMDCDTYLTALESNASYFNRHTENQKHIQLFKDIEDSIKDITSYLIMLLNNSAITAHLKSSLIKSYERVHNSHTLLNTYHIQLLTCTSILDIKNNSPIEIIQAIEYIRSPERLTEHTDIYNQHSRLFYNLHRAFSDLVTDTSFIEAYHNKMGVLETLQHKADTHIAHLEKAIKVINHYILNTSPTSE